MNFKNYYWADSDLQSVYIEYDKAVLKIWNDALQKVLTVYCTGLVGMTNLCIWDDTIIHNADIFEVVDTHNIYLQNLFSAYDAGYNYGGRRLSDGLYELRIELVNNISFSVYCQNVNVVEEI